MLSSYRVTELNTNLAANLQWNHMTKIEIIKVDSKLFWWIFCDESDAMNGHTVFHCSEWFKGRT